MFINPQRYNNTCNHYHIPTSTKNILEFLDSFYSHSLYKNYVSQLCISLFDVSNSLLSKIQGSIRLYKRKERRKIVKNEHNTKYPQNLMSFSRQGCIMGLLRRNNLFWSEILIQGNKNIGRWVIKTHLGCLLCFVTSVVSIYFYIFTSRKIFIEYSYVYLRRPIKVVLETKD